MEGYHGKQNIGSKICIYLERPWPNLRVTMTAGVVAPIKVASCGSFRRVKIRWCSPQITCNSVILVSLIQETCTTLQKGQYCLSTSNQDLHSFYEEIGSNHTISLITVTSHRCWELNDGHYTKVDQRYLWLLYGSKNFLCHCAVDCLQITTVYYIYI